MGVGGDFAFWTWKHRLRDFVPSKRRVGDLQMDSVSYKLEFQFSISRIKRSNTPVS